MHEDLPMSRLSKRTTRKPRAARALQKSVLPPDHLRAEAHHQQHRRVGLGAESLIAKRQAVRLGELFAGVELRDGHSLAPAR